MHDFEPRRLSAIPTTSGIPTRLACKRAQAAGIEVAPLLKKAGLTQSDLGKNIHLRQGTVSRLEAGAPAIQLRTLMEALAALELELIVRPRSPASAADIESAF